MRSCLAARTGGEVGEEEGPFWACRCPLSGRLWRCDWPAGGTATAADATAVVSRSGSAVAASASAAAAAANIDADAGADAQAEPDAPALDPLLTQAVLKEPVRPAAGPRPVMAQALGGAGAGAGTAVLL